MHELDDNALLRQCAEQNSEAAFATLVARHVDKVFSVALRHTRNAHAAEEITQAVFVILAKKSGRLGAKVILAGWLYETARLTALTYIRSEIRRARREQEAHMQTALNENDNDAWPHIAPLLDDAMAKLSAADRHAVVLRYFDGKSLGEVGAAMGASEDGAKKRVTRAVEKLRSFFTKRGATLTATVLTAAISANSVQAAPLGLVKTISVIAIAKGATAGGSTLALVKGALKIMAWTKMKTAIVVTVGVLLAAATATITVKEIQKHRTYPWQVETDDLNKVLATAPPMVEIRPAKFLKSRVTVTHHSDGNVQRLEFGIPIQMMLFEAYDSRPTRAILPKLPQDKYDFIVSLPQGSSEALAKEIKQKFGLIGKKELLERDVLLLKLSNSDAPSFKANTNFVAGHDDGDAHFNKTIGDLLWQNSLEDTLHLPIIDKTGLSNRYDYTFHYPEWNPSWSTNFNALKQGLKDALHSQLGLELVPSREPVEMLVVEKVK